MGRYGRACSGGDDLAVYDSYRMEHDIDLALVVGYEGDDRYQGNSHHIGSLAAASSWIAPLAYSHAGSPILPSKPFVGISLYLSSAQDANRLSAWPKAAVEALSARRSIVSVNAAPSLLQAVGDALRRLEGCAVLISHLGDPGAYRTHPTPEETRRTLSPLLSLAGAGNIGVKLSGLYGISDPPHDYPHTSARPFVELAVEAFGTDRLYWGSDFSPALDHVSFVQAVDAVSELPWSEAERASIMGGNLRRLLRHAFA